jgi:hypothetical protein
MADKSVRRFDLKGKLARGRGVHHGSSEKPRRRSNDRHQQLLKQTQGFQPMDTTSTRPSAGSHRHPFGGSDGGPADVYEAKRRRSQPASQRIRRPLRPPLPVKTTAQAHPRRAGQSNATGEGDTYAFAAEGGEGSRAPRKQASRDVAHPNMGTVFNMNKRKATAPGTERGVGDVLQQTMRREGANEPKLASLYGQPARRVTRAAAAGNPAARWTDGNHHGATYEGSRRSSRTSSSASTSASYVPHRGYGRRGSPQEESPSRKRQRELNQRGGDAEAAITLSSSDEDEEGVEEGGAGGVQSFSLHDDKVYFGRTPMVATPSKVEFTTAGLRLPVPEIWGQDLRTSPDIAVVPYDAIQCISYCTEGKPAFMSIELKPGAFKTGVIEASVDGFKVSRASKFDDVCDRRVLAPLRDGAAFLKRLPRVTALLPAQQPPPMAGSRGNEACLLKKLEFAMATPLLDNIPLYRRRNTRSSTRKGGRGTGGGVAEQELMAFYPPTGKDRVKITRADWKLLGQYEMVNDTVIDFYLKWLEHTVLRADDGHTPMTAAPAPAPPSAPPPPLQPPANQEKKVAPPPLPLPVKTTVPTTGATLLHEAATHRAKAPLSEQFLFFSSFFYKKLLAIKNKGTCRRATLCLRQRHLVVLLLRVVWVLGM